MLWFRAPEKVYLKKGCLPVALSELKTVMGKKKAFIVTDSFLYHNGYTKPITDKLDEMGIQHTTFFDVAPDPTLACAKEGAKAMASFEPDCIIALGGGSGSSLGTGGMATKLLAAQIAVGAGCEMVIANGEKPELLYDIVAGKPIGTRFLVKR